MQTKQNAKMNSTKIVELYRHLRGEDKLFERLLSTFKER